MWIRNAYITIRYNVRNGRAEREETISNAAIEFSVRLVALASQGQTATIRVANLAKADVLRLATTAGKWATQSGGFGAQNPVNSIRLFAGWVDDGAPMIYEGTIVQATPEGLPDTWLTFECANNYESRFIAQTMDPIVGTIQNIAQRIAGLFGATLEVRSRNVLRQANFSSGSRSLWDCLLLFQRMFPELLLWIDAQTGKMYLDDALAVARPADSSSALIVSGDGQRGNLKMIGLPEWNDQYSGIEFKTMLAPTLRPLTWVRIDSSRYPQLFGNSLFRVRTIEHSGQTRGNDYYSHIWAVKPSADFVGA